MREPQIDFEKFFLYDELCAHINALAAWKPELASVRAIGQSLEGRDLLLLEVTNSLTGSGRDKPAFLVHGNIHACELSGSTCALRLAYHLLANGDTDPLVRELLDQVAVHIIPRVSPDGAEQVMTQQHTVRSRERVEQRKNCVWPADINGDGLILKMRAPDPNGEWFSPADEPRLLVQRMPGDDAGRRYRLATEGLIHDWDGGPWEDSASTGYDFNRNWPSGWLPRHRQWGAGNYPFSEPEVRAVADHVFAHPNTFGVFGLHNGTNAVLRPPTSTGDDAMNAADMLAFRRLAELGADITGFPAKAIHEYRNVLAQPIRLHGTFSEWGYYHCGLFAMEIELGNLYNGAGYDTERIFHLTPEQECQRDRDCLAWHDAHPEAGVFVDWQPFDHPQLGPVELGGMTPQGLYNVVPDQRLAVWDKACRFMVELARRGPRLALSKVSAEPLGDGLYRVSCRVANEGYLPTHVTSLGAGLSHVDGVRVEVERDGDIAFVANRNRIELGHLGPSDCRDLDWVVRAVAGSVITILAHAPRAGRCVAEVSLD